MPAGRVVIEYLRPPDRLERFEQRIVLQTAAWTITYLARAKVARPVTAAGRVILEPDAPIVWFSYPGEWHDVGRFHLANGDFTGFYANVLTPVVMEGASWRTTDLFLDVWMPREGAPALLDVEELDEAVQKGWLEETVAARARAHAEELLAAARSGSWPPAHVREWTLERVREHLAIP